MSDHLDRDTVERLLRGEDTGPPRLAALLTAASAKPLRHDRRGEEIVVTAFREARSDAGAAVCGSRRVLRPRLITVKAALIGFGFALVGGVAVAASTHLPLPVGGKHTPAHRTPATSSSPAEHRIATVPAHASPSASAKAHASRTRDKHHGKGKGNPLPSGGPTVHPPKGNPHLKPTHSPNLKSHWPPEVKAPSASDAAVPGGR